jgi:hypothetical protein
MHTHIKRKRVTCILLPVAPHIAILLVVLGSDHMKILISCAQCVGSGGGGVVGAGKECHQECPQTAVPDFL